MDSPILTGQNAKIERPGAVLKRLLPILDWFIPEALRSDLPTLRRARFFVFGHLLPPPLSLGLILYSYWLLPHLADPVRLFLLAAIGMFFLFPFILKLGVCFEALVFASTQWFALVIIYAAFHYGGANSPFLAWFAALPVSGVFYIGMQRVLLRNLLIGMILLDFLGFYLAYRLGFSLPQDYSVETLTDIGLWSHLAVAAYVASMVMGSLGVVAAQQDELEHEVTVRRATEINLLRAKDDAERATRTKSVFLANTSHELRTPLNAILGFSELMKTEALGPIGTPRYREYAQDIHDSGSRLLHIINDLIDLSKIEAGKAALDQEEELDLNLIIQNVEHQAQPLAEHSGVKFIVEPNSHVPHVQGSERMLQRILMNISSNAIKFTPAGGEVRLGTRIDEGGNLAITIVDTGVGMTKDELAVALTPFGQLHSEIAHSDKGAGLGLPLAKALIEMHGGLLAIRSNPGQGTSVTITLPKSRILV